jgi:hypothetical protein
VAEVWELAVVELATMVGGERVLRGGSSRLHDAGLPRAGAAPLRDGDVRHGLWNAHAAEKLGLLDRGCWTGGGQCDHPTAVASPHWVALSSRLAHLPIHACALVQQ